MRSWVGLITKQLAVTCPGNWVLEKGAAASKINFSKAETTSEEPQVDSYAFNDSMNDGGIMRF